MRTIPRFEGRTEPLSVQELAGVFAVSAITVLRAIKRGDLRAFKPGKRQWRVFPCDAAEWAVNTGKVKP